MMNTGTAPQAFEPVVSKISSGIPGFDLVAHGGLPEGRPTLVSGTSGSAKTILALQYIVSGIEQHDAGGVFVTFEETPEDIRRNVKSFNWDLEDHERSGQLAIVDVSPDTDDEVIESGGYDLSALIARIESAVKRVNAKRVSIDSIGAIFRQFSDAGLVRRELFRLAVALKRMCVTSIITSERLAEYGDVARFGVEEFVADNVIIMRNVLDKERRRRTVEILKYRGAPHQKGEFPFTISERGIEVLPLSAMKLTQRSSTVRISTGNDVLDEMCGGGFFRDSVILASGATGTGKTLTVTTFLDDGSRRGEKTLVFAFEESRDQLLRNAIGWGKDFRKSEDAGLLEIVCSYPESRGLEDHLLFMKRKIESFNPSRIALDSLSALERVSTERSFREFVIALTSFIKERETAGLFTATTSSLLGGTSITETHISTLTDTILLMRYVELMGKMERGITVLKMRGSWHDKGIRRYDIDGTGMHIGKPFVNVGGILAGAPTHIATVETEMLEGMFDASRVGAAAV